MNIKIVVIVYSLYCIHYSIKIKYMYITYTNVNFN